MTGLVKASAAQADVRPLVLPSGIKGGAAPQLAANPLELRLAAAGAEIARLHEALAEAEAAGAKRTAAAREQGLREGKAAATREEERRIEALEVGIAAACTEWTERLSSLEALAPQIAKAALAKLFEPTADLAEAVERTVARTMRRLEGETVLTIRVSASDFADAAALERLAACAATSGAAVVADPQLAAGECRMDLSLGHLDLSLAGQWRELGQLLDRMADGSSER